MSGRAHRSLVRGGLAVTTAGAVAVAVVLTTSTGPVAAEAVGHEYGVAVEPGVTVNGLGLAATAPDVLRVHLAIAKQAPDVSAAIEGANAGVRRIRAALHKAGVAAADISTSDFSVHSGHTKKPGAKYVANHALSVILRDLSRAGQTIADAAKAGGNDTRIYSVGYDISDRTKLLQKARDAAFADAKAKAEAYAKLAGRGLGSVRSVHEGHPEYYYYGDSALSGGGLSAPSTVPLSPGTRNVSVAATVVWNLV